MPLLPLYDSNAAADAWHRVRAPGGYEWWHVDAEDAAQDLRISGDLFEGYIFHPRYVRRSARYGLWPLSCPPPTPGKFVCAALSVYRGRQAIAQFIRHYPATQFSAGIGDVPVRIGPNELQRPSQGQTRHLWLSPPDMQPPISADWVLRPTWDHPPLELKILRDAAAAQHRWIVSPSPCLAQGSLRIGDQTIAFSGTGYREHRFGSAMPGLGVRRWMSGRIQNAQRGLAFHIAQWTSRRPAEVTLVEADRQGARQRPLSSLTVGPEKHTLLGLAYPRELKLQPAVELHSPRLIDANPYRLRLVYEASMEGQQVRACCEIVYPQRLRWPVLDVCIQRQIGE